MNVAALQRELEPRAKKLAHDLAAILVRFYAGEVEATRTAAREQLARQLDGLTAIAPVERKPRPKKRRVAKPKKSKPAIARKAKPARMVAEPPPVVERDVKPAKVIQAEPAAREPRRCKICRQPGHRADRCPEREQPAPIVNAAPVAVNKPAPSPPSPPPPSAAKRDRFARIEAAARARLEAIE